MASNGNRGTAPHPDEVFELPLSQSCPIVGVGASAGGLEAMTELLRELPDDPGFGVVFIQHPDPSSSGMLPDLLARATRMPVEVVAREITVEPNHVYVIQPNSPVSIRKGTLLVEPRDPHPPSMPIDQFFRSLAEDQGSKAIAVVLSGTDSDGTLGLRAIKGAGGIALVQEPQSARFDDMPRNAIQAGYADIVLSAHRIAGELVRLSRHRYLDHLRSPDHPLPEDKAFEEILTMLRASKGVDFTNYKTGTLRRRTMRRMALHRLDSPEKYARYLAEHAGELDLLFNDLLIRVTSFFREQEALAAVAEGVLPKLFADRGANDPLRVWVPGCATGEEVYSVAICILESMERSGLHAPIQFFGTDLSEPALAQARTGMYPANIEADVSPDRLRRYFVPCNGGYQIAAAIRGLCIFARQNVTQDPPFSRLDLITCRNLLIYLGPTLQANFMRLFHQALKPSGFLVLGSSETVGGSIELFSPADRRHKIYSRRPVATPLGTEFKSYDESLLRQPERRPNPPPTIDQALDQLLIANCVPPAVLIDSDLRVIRFRGDTTAFLRHPLGAPSLHLTRLAPPSIVAEVRRLILQSREHPGILRSNPLSVVDGIDRQIRLSLIPASDTRANDTERHFLIVFEDLSIRGSSTSTGNPASAAEDRIHALEDELSSSRRLFQSLAESHDAATEELKSAHEEVQSANEELQSTNEVLLVTKEELQSMNEELTTLNDEMNGRNVELQQINNDLANLLANVNVPFLILGEDLRVRRFTPNAERILTLRSTDVGSPIEDLRLRVNVPDLPQLCREVLDSLVPSEREVQDATGRFYSVWVRPYRTSDNRIDGVVLSLFDITERRQTAEIRYRRLFEAAGDAIVIVDGTAGEIVDVNPVLTKLLGHTRSRLIGARFWESDLFRNSSSTESLRGELRNRESVEPTAELITTGGDSLPVAITAFRYTENQREMFEFHIRVVRAAGHTFVRISA